MSPLEVLAASAPRALSLLGASFAATMLLVVAAVLTEDQLEGWLALVVERAIGYAAMAAGAGWAVGLLWATAAMLARAVA